MIKKIIFSLLATTFCLFLIRPVFTVYTPFELKIHAKGNTRAKFEVSYTPDKAKNFENAISLYAYINLKHEKQAVFRFTARQLESLKIKTDRSVKVTSIEITGEQTVSLKPVRLLTYKNLEIFPKTQTDYRLFFICLTLSFFFFLKIFSYLQAVCLQEKKASPDIAFVVLFAAILCLPALKINDDKISGWENKTLAKYVPLWRFSKLNLNYGKDFEEWFNDRFFLRKPIITSYRFLESHLKRNESNQVLFGKEGWLFYNADIDIQDYQNNADFSDKQLKNTLNYLKDLNEWSKKNGKKFYILFAPDKHRIYGEFYPPQIKKKKPDSENPFSRIITELNKTDIKYVYPEAELKAEKNNALVYWINDTHWNEYGAYIAYRSLMNMIAQDDPSLAPKEYIFERTYSKRHGNLSVMLPQGADFGKKGTYKKAKYNFQTKYAATSFNHQSKHENFKRTKPSLPNGKKVVVMMDSFFRSVSPYFGEHFAEVQEFWQRDTSPQILEQAKEADIILLEIRAGTTHSLKGSHFSYYP